MDNASRGTELVQRTVSWSALPNELLSDIFDYHVSSHKVPILAIQRIWVCRRWRAVAFATPQLWNRIVVRLQDFHHAVDIIRCHLEHRSALLLDITLEFANCDKYSDFSCWCRGPDRDEAGYSVNYNDRPRCTVKLEEAFRDSILYLVGFDGSIMKQHWKAFSIDLTGSSCLFNSLRRLNGPAMSLITLQLTGVNLGGSFGARLFPSTPKLEDARIHCCQNFDRPFLNTVTKLKVGTLDKRPISLQECQSLASLTIRTRWPTLAPNGVNFSNLRHLTLFMLDGTFPIAHYPSIPSLEKVTLILDSYLWIHQHLYCQQLLPRKFASAKHLEIAWPSHRKAKEDDKEGKERIRMEQGLVGRSFREVFQTQCQHLEELTVEGGPVFVAVLNAINANPNSFPRLESVWLDDEISGCAKFSAQEINRMAMFAAMNPR